MTCPASTRGAGELHDGERSKLASVSASTGGPAELAAMVTSLMKAAEMSGAPSCTARHLALIMASQACPITPSP